MAYRPKWRVPIAKHDVDGWSYGAKRGEMPEWNGSEEYLDPRDFDFIPAWQWRLRAKLTLTGSDNKSAYWRTDDGRTFRMTIGELVTLVQNEADIFPGGVVSGVWRATSKGVKLGIAYEGPLDSGPRVPSNVNTLTITLPYAKSFVEEAHRDLFPDLVAGEAAELAKVGARGLLNGHDVSMTKNDLEVT